MVPVRVQMPSVPDAACECGAVLYVTDPKCPDCGMPRPLSGWQSVSEVSDPWLGQPLSGRWLPRRKIGSGSTAAVYRVESIRVPRWFALKIVDLDRAMCSSRTENLASVQREVEIVGRLKNPHIVQIYELIELSDQHVALLMEYVEGPTLRDMVNRDGPIAPNLALEIIRQLANALHEVHTEGIVHCDLKPENVLVETLGSGAEFVRLTDFGIASEIGSRQDGFVGTPLWASPEQILSTRLDARSDIYSIGTLLYYLLTGQPPFYDENYTVVLKSHLSADRPRLRFQGQRTFSAALEQFVARLLSREPEGRPCNLLMLLRDIAELYRMPNWDWYEESTLGSQTSEAHRFWATFDAEVEQTAEDLPYSAASSLWSNQI